MSKIFLYFRVRESLTYRMNFLSVLPLLFLVAFILLWNGQICAHDSHHKRGSEMGMACELLCLSDTTLFLTRDSCMLSIHRSAPNLSADCGDPNTYLLNYKVFTLASPTELISEGVGNLSVNIPSGEYLVRYRLETFNSILVDDCEYSIQVIDSFFPRIECASDMTIRVDGRSQCEVTLAPEVWLPSFVDTCFAHEFQRISITNAKGEVDTFFNYDRMPSYTFSLGNNLLTSQFLLSNDSIYECVSYVNIRDSVPPAVLNCPSDYTVNAVGGACQAAVTFDLLEIDSMDCDRTADQYVRIIDYADQIFPPSREILPVGIYEIEYVLEDRSENQTVCRFKVRVTDNRPPELSLCPMNEVLYISEGCTAESEISLPGQVDDPCFDSNMQIDTVERNLPFDPSTAEAEGFFIHFDDQIAHGFADARLQFFLWGDVDDPTEQFSIMDEDGNILGNTATRNSASCEQYTLVTISLEAQEMKRWLQDDSRISFELSPLSTGLEETSGDDPNIYAINDFCPDGTMGSPRIRALLRVSEILDFYYRVINQRDTSDIRLLPKGDTVSSHVFEKGINQVELLYYDISGDEGSCSYFVELVDTLSPFLELSDDTIFLMPDEWVQKRVDPFEIVSDVGDNCELQDLVISPATLSCTRFGMDVFFDFTAIDGEGYRTRRTGTHFVSPYLPNIEQSYSVCLGSNLFIKMDSLYAEESVFQYEWINPLGETISRSKNLDVIIDDVDNEGTYQLNIRHSIEACSISLPFTVDILEEVSVPIPSDSIFMACLGSDVQLSIDNVEAGSVMIWFLYDDSQSGFVEFDRTLDPFLFYTPTRSRIDSFYVQTVLGSCLSEPSQVFLVETTDPPLLDLQNDSIQVCEEEMIILESSMVADSFFWSGPNGFQSGNNPAIVSNSAQESDEAWYFLQVTSDHCRSNVDSIFVFVDDRPEQAEVIAKDLYCYNEQITLRSSIGRADSFEWHLPDGSIRITTENSIEIEESEKMDGIYRLRIKEGGCFSDFSSSKFIDIESEQDFQIESNAPICEGDTFSVEILNPRPGDYLWVGPGFSQSSANFELANPVNGNYILRYESRNNCETRDTILLEVHEIPVINIISVNPPNGTCLTGQDSVVLKASIDNFSQNELQYEWIDPSGNRFIGESLIIPNADADINGTYSLRVTSTDNCNSDWRTIELNYRDAPGAPQIVFSEPVCEGSPLLVTSSQQPGANVNYLWNTPAGDRATSTPDLVFDNASKRNHEGHYRVRVSVDNCISAWSDLTFIDILSRPEEPNIITDTIYCEGDTIRLITKELDSVTYLWQGPNRILSDSHEVFIPDAMIMDEGTYTLRILNRDDCISPMNEIEISVSPVPERALIVSNTPLCSDDSLILQTQNILADSFLWIDPGQNEFVSLYGELRLPSDMLSQGEWQVISYRGHCTSPISTPHNVSIEAPLELNLSSNSPICDGDTLRLRANYIDNVSYRWLNSRGEEISILRNIDVVDPDNDLYFLEMRSSINCEYRDSISVLIHPLPRIEDILIVGPNCVNGNQDIQLIPTVTSVNDQASYSFIWTGSHGIGLDSIFNIRNATIADQGEYQLQVMDEFGCIAREDGILLELDEIPATPAIEQLRPICEGDSLHLFTQSFSGADVEYEWNYGGQTILSTSPELVLPYDESLLTSLFTVTVLTPACNSATSLSLRPDIKPRPEAPQIDYPFEVCSGDSLSLVASAIAGGRYFWRGPNEFSAGLRNPVIPRAREENEGFYSVRVELEGCSSAFSDSVFVKINAIPPSPIILPIDPICLDYGQQTIQIDLDTINISEFSTVSIYDALTDSKLDGPRNSTSFILDVNDLNENIEQVYALQEVDGCVSRLSNIRSLGIFSIPDSVTANIESEEPLVICNEPRFLRANSFPRDTHFYGLWRQVGGENDVRIQSPNSSTTDVNFSDLRAGASYQFEWSVSYGACETYDSDTINLIKIDADQKATAEDLTICNTDQIQLAAEPAQGIVTGYWSQSASQANIVSIQDTLNPNTLVTGLIPENENYFFRWSLTHPACPDFSFVDVRVQNKQKEPCNAYAGSDQTVCGNSEVRLRASSDNNCEIGSWTTNSGSFIEDPHALATRVLDLQDGANIFVFSLVDVECGLFSSDTMIVNYYDAASAQDDVYEIDIASILNLDVLSNDLNFEDANIEIIEEPRFGRVELNSDQVQYFANPSMIGSDQFSYQLCDLRCISHCDTANVTLSIGENVNCDIPTLFTPNGDQVNDQFIIPCLATNEYPNNRVQIFNQWGDIVYEQSPYLNQWKGEFKGEDLPAGTYYYIVEFGGAEETQSGFLIIQR